MRSFRMNVAFAALASILAIAGAKAGPTGNPPQLVVSYGDLDLTSPEGAQVLLARLRLASTAVCGGVPDGRELDRVSLYKRCSRKALDGAVVTVDRPMVTAVYHGTPLPRVASSRR